MSRGEAKPADPRRATSTEGVAASAVSAVAMLDFLMAVAEYVSSERFNNDEGDWIKVTLGGDEWGEDFLGRTLVDALAKATAFVSRDARSRADRGAQLLADAGLS